VRVAGNIVVVAIAVMRYMHVDMRRNIGTRAATMTILVRPMEMIVRETADGKRQQIGGGR